MIRIMQGIVTFKHFYGFMETILCQSFLNAMEYLIYINNFVLKLHFRTKT